MQNYGVTIYFSNNDRTDLQYNLEIIGELGKQLSWRVFDVECLGESAEILHQISDEKTGISGEDFYNIVSNIYQVLEGTFEAYKSNHNQCYILIRSIRGTEFDIETEDLELLKRIRDSFQDVKDLIY